MIIFTCVIILSAFGVIKTLQEKNFLGALFAIATFLVFGFFVVATITTNGFPVIHK
jgi:hypothetical protein